MKVMFEPLPQESFLRALIRKVLKKSRPKEFITISLNGRTIVVSRGIPVNVPAWVAAVGSGAGCYLLLDMETGKNLAAIEAMQ